MNNILKILYAFLVLNLLNINPTKSQDVEASPFDFGRMWTFENPPVDWFKEAYSMDVDQAWFDDVRKSSLRFASWCSASFVSPNGLIMTNHHCSRDVAISVQEGEENFDKNGFYASTNQEERRVNDLFVEQLIKVEDLTDRILKVKASAENESHALELEQAELEKIKAEYNQKAEWSDLRLQTVSFYSGGRYSLYGYKKYTDIRLVFIPENDLGFYGGDPDNFTYPRYNLDFTFWRAYDESGQPLNTSEFYFEFNIDGIKEGTPVFVIGNPGRTERYRTTAQLNYDRDYRFKHLLKWITNRRDLLQEDYNLLSQDDTKVREAQELLSTINNLSNSIKAYNGIMSGLKNPHFMARKKAMEEKIKNSGENLTYWNDLENHLSKMEPHAWAANLLRPSGLKGNAFLAMHELANYKRLLSEDSSEEDKEASKQKLLDLTKSLDVPKEKRLLSTLFNEISEEIYPKDNTLQRILNGKSLDAFVENLFAESKILQGGTVAEKCISKSKNIKKEKDPLVKVSEVLVNRYNEASAINQASSPIRQSLLGKISNQAFSVYGNALPPDATFTLRISDGLVKRYEYNGTLAPVKTTFFGLYDRHYSNDKMFPWSLPERWQDPSMELLKSPLNFVSTNDIIGGNSGSAIINQDRQAVGLIFDGNIESLPGNFIFDEQYNRSVSVHAGGIYAALKYVYKADNLVKELVAE